MKEKENILDNMNFQGMPISLTYQKHSNTSDQILEGDSCPSIIMFNSLMGIKFKPKQRLSIILVSFLYVYSFYFIVHDDSSLFKFEYAIYAI